MIDAAGKGTAKRRRGRQDDKRPGSSTKNKHQSVSTPAVESSGQSQKVLLTLTEEEPTWYRIAQQQAERNATLVTNPPEKGSPRMTPELISKYRRQADELYQKELFAYKGSGKSSDDRWVEGTMKKGTLKDRIAATSVVASTDPIHKLFALDNLLQMAGCAESGSQQTNSRVVLLAAEALEDLFLNTFLPPERKLISLAQRPLNLYEHAGEAKKQTMKTLSPKILLLWRFEELVKDKYHRFLRQCLEKTLRDGMEMDKISALRTTSSLLSSAPEGEAVLLQLLVNKLGDPAKKVAAAAGHELRKVLEKHPSMQNIIAREVQQLSFRPGLKSRALYHCITFLNQLKLRREKPDADGNVKASLPASLINSYFRLFDVAIKKQLESKGDDEDAEMKSRLLSALLSGINRAHPYLPEKDKSMDEHLDSLYRVVHTAPPGACTQALLLLFHVAVGSKSDDHGDDDVATDASGKRQQRFYRALYASLSKTNLLSSGKHLTMLFNLLYKAMKYDSDTTRVISFAKRILCTTLHCSSSVMAASIFLLNEISRTHAVVLFCFQEVLEEPNCRRILDPSKREPNGALVVDGDPDTADDDRAVKKAPLWEFALISHHFHPSVDKFAVALGEIGYNGDPLKDFSLLQFLDKFAYRNPKSSQHVAEKLKQGASVGVRRSGKESIVQSLSATPVNDPSFVQRQKVDVHEEFFHRFFVERAKRDGIKGIDKKKPSDPIDGEDEEEKALHDDEQFDAGSRFEEFERQWDSDSDEEEFVDSLAQQIIEDAIDKHGPDELDDEDPDMDDWGDMHEAAFDHEIPVGDVANRSDDEDDDDEFMEESDGEEDSEAPSLLDIGEGESDADFDSGPGEGSSSDDGVLVADDSDEEEEDGAEGREKALKLKNLPTFADVDDYEELIAESLSKQKRSHSGPGVDRTGSLPEPGRKRKKNKR